MTAAFLKLEKKSAQDVSQRHSTGRDGGRTEEVDLRGLDAVLEDVAERDEAREETALVRLRQALHQGLEADLVDERLGHRTAEDGTPSREVLLRTTSAGVSFAAARSDARRDPTPRAGFEAS